MSAEPARNRRKGPPEEVQIAALLSALGAKQGTAFAELLRPLDLRPKQFAVMNIVDLGEGISQQQLGRAMELDPSGLIATLDDLEARNLIERRRDPNDRRRHALYLTEPGTRLLAEGRTLARHRAEALTAGLSPAERKQLLKLLVKLT